MQRMERQRERRLLRRRTRYWILGNGKTEHGMTIYMPACTRKCIEYLTNFAYGYTCIITAP